MEGTKLHVLSQHSTWERARNAIPALLRPFKKMHGDARLKNRLRMSTNSACQCHMTVLWMSNELLHEQCARVRLRMELCCRLIPGAMSLPPIMSTTWIVIIRGTIHRTSGTALRATNHLSRVNQGDQRAAIQMNFSDKYVPELPNSYALIHPVELSNNHVFVRRSTISQVRSSHSIVQGAKMKDELRMAHFNSVLQHDTLPEDEVITWSGYNSRLMNDDSLKPPAGIGVLPLFPDKADSTSVIKQAMQLTMQGAGFLNPGQTGVLRADQPLYAKAKQLQWTFPKVWGKINWFLYWEHYTLKTKFIRLLEKCYVIQDGHSTFSGTCTNIWSC